MVIDDKASLNEPKPTDKAEDRAYFKLSFEPQRPVETMARMFRLHPD
jgi:hypothetical protein